MPTPSPRPFRMRSTNSSPVWGLGPDPGRRPTAEVSPTIPRRVRRPDQCGHDLTANATTKEPFVKQLTGFDAAMLYMETPRTFCHVAALMIFETPSPDFDPRAAVYAKFASLVGELEPLRRRLVDVPLGLDHPYWVADADVDLGFHIRK